MKEHRAKYLARITCTGIGMGWYAALVNWVIWVWVVLGSCSIFTEVMTTVETHYGGSLINFLFTGPTWFINFFIVAHSVVGIVLLIIIRDKLQSFAHNTIKFIIIYVVVNLGGVAILLMLHALFVDYYEALVQTLSYLIVMPIFIWPNYIYFKKRKHLFVCDNFGNPLPGRGPTLAATDEPPMETISKPVPPAAPISPISPQGAPPDTPISEPNFILVDSRVATLATPAVLKSTPPEKEKKIAQKITLPLIIISVLGVALIASLIALYSANKNFDNQLAKSAQEVNSLKSDLSHTQDLAFSLSKQVQDYKKRINEVQNDSLEHWRKAIFLDENIALTLPNGRIYHTLDCYYVSDANHIYYQTIDDAVSWGYSACQSCH